MAGRHVPCWQATLELLGGRDGVALWTIEGATNHCYPRNFSSHLGPLPDTPQHFFPGDKKGRHNISCIPSCIPSHLQVSPANHQNHPSATMSIPAFSDIAKSANDVSTPNELLRKRTQTSARAAFPNLPDPHQRILSQPLTTHWMSLVDQQGLLPPLGWHPRGQEQHAQQCCLQGDRQEQP